MAHQSARLMVCAKNRHTTADHTPLPKVCASLAPTSELNAAALIADALRASSSAESQPRH
jgi:hypothetical protein